MSERMKDVENQLAGWMMRGQAAQAAVNKIIADAPKRPVVMGEQAKKASRKAVAKMRGKSER